MRKIGILGGSFNPIHFGHIHVALQVQERKKLDHVFFSPNYISPFSEKKDGWVDPYHRIEMLCLALEGVPNCSILDYETLKQEPSYTIDLINYLYTLPDFCNDELFLLLGEDSLERFHQWKEYEKLLQLTHPLVATRIVEKKVEFFCPNLEKVDIPILEISSSMVRDRLQKGLFCGHLVPSKVLDYIHDNKLYLCKKI